MQLKYGRGMSSDPSNAPRPVQKGDLLKWLDTRKDRRTFFVTKVRTVAGNQEVQVLPSDADAGSRDAQRGSAEWRRASLFKVVTPSPAAPAAPASEGS